MKITIEHSSTPDGHDSDDVVVEKGRSAPLLEDVECALSLVPNDEYVQNIEIDTEYGGDGA